MRGDERARTNPFPHRWDHQAPRFNARGDVHCRRCERYLPRDWFRADDRCAAGIYSYCRPCTRAYQKRRYGRLDDAAVRAKIAQATAYRRRKRRELQRERLAGALATVADLERFGLSERAIAAGAGIDVETLRRWKRRGAIPRDKTIAKLGRFYAETILRRAA